MDKLHLPANYLAINNSSHVFERQFLATIRRVLELVDPTSKEAFAWESTFDPKLVEETFLEPVAFGYQAQVREVPRSRSKKKGEQDALRHVENFVCQYNESLARLLVEISGRLTVTAPAVSDALRRAAVRKLASFVRTAVDPSRSVRQRTGGCGLSMLEYIK